MLSCAYIRTCEAKKRAKLLQIFYMAKYFCKKMYFFRDFLDFVHSTWQNHARMGL